MNGLHITRFIFILEVLVFRCSLKRELLVVTLAYILFFRTFLTRPGMSVRKENCFFLILCILSVLVITVIFYFFI